MPMMPIDNHHPIYPSACVYSIQIDNNRLNRVHRLSRFATSSSLCMCICYNYTITFDVCVFVVVEFNVSISPPCSLYILKVCSSFRLIECFHSHSLAIVMIRLGVWCVCVYVYVYECLINVWLRYAYTCASFPLKCFNWQSNKLN